MIAHGIMFHHFHSCFDNEMIYIKQQGSIDSSSFVRILKFLQRHYNIIEASEFLEKSQNNELVDNDLVITFDDNLSCQYAIAKPILDEYGIKAIWFINSMNLCSDSFDYLEVYRHFRNYSYSTIDDFYTDFFNSIEGLPRDRIDFLPRDYLVECPFYSDNDKCFKYLRDEILDENEYRTIMFKLMGEKAYNWKTMINKLSMSKEQIKQLSDEGHVIGLHSHSHNMNLFRLSYDEQYRDYKQNKSILEEICNKQIVSVSYPGGLYSNDTLSVLNELNIHIGFVDNMQIQTINNRMLIPREDHANIIRYLDIQ